MKGIIISIVLLFLLNSVIPFVLKNVNISIQSYLMYLLWANALLLFFMVLPSQAGVAFYPS